MPDTPIRMVAVDMDGTFLRNDKTYDRARFARLHERMRARGVRFVVASGNQYEQLHGFFDDVADDLAYVAENGSYVLDAGEVVHAAGLSPADVARVADLLDAQPTLTWLASGPEGAFVPHRMGEDFIAMMSFYYPRLTRVGSLDDVRAPLFKFSLEDPAGLPDGLLARLASDLAGVATPTSSGHTSIDLVVPGVHKAAGLELLADRWGVAPQECAAFGDGGNDVEMLRWAGHSWAMADAPAAVHDAARYRAASNDDDGVLDVLARWFG